MTRQSGDVEEREDDRAEGSVERTADERESREEDPISRHVAESIAFGRYMISAWADGVRVRVRHGIMATLLLIAALPVLLIVVGLALHMVLQSLAVAVAEGMALPAWAGELLVGAAVLIVVIGGIGFMIYRLEAQSRKRVMEEYEQTQEQQRNAFGADVHEQATAG